MTAAEIQELFSYDRWANDGVLETVQRLTQEQYTRDLGSSYPSVRDTLAHIMSADWIWLMRLRGTSPAARPEHLGAETAAELARHWRMVQADWAAHVAQLSPEQLAATVAYKNIKGDPFESQVGQILRHKVNHSTYHRGQVVTMLRQLGVTPPTTDLIAFYRRTAPLSA